MSTGRFGFNENLSTKNFGEKKSLRPIDREKEANFIAVRGRGKEEAMMDHH